MKILNLYAGIGGNRRLWTNENFKITSVENDEQIANIYRDFFPGDNVVITDAHQFLLDNYDKYDFIWSSPPCITHSRLTYIHHYYNKKSRYPDMTLYQEIIFLQSFCKALWCVENVNPYYKPLIRPTIKIGRHLFWSNFNILQSNITDIKIYGKEIKEFEIEYNISLKKYNLKPIKRRQILRNYINPEIGKYILDSGLKSKGV